MKASSLHDGSLGTVSPRPIGRMSLNPIPEDSVDASALNPSRAEEWHEIVQTPQKLLVQDESNIDHLVEERSTSVEHLQISSLPPSPSSSPSSSPPPPSYPPPALSQPSSPASQLNSWQETNPPRSPFTLQNSTITSSGDPWRVGSVVMTDRTEPMDLSPEEETDDQPNEPGTPRYRSHTSTSLKKKRFKPSRIKGVSSPDDPHSHYFPRSPRSMLEIPQPVLSSAREEQSPTKTKRSKKGKKMRNSDSRRDFAEKDGFERDPKKQTKVFTKTNSASINDAKLDSTKSNSTKIEQKMAGTVPKKRAITRVKDESDSQVSTKNQSRKSMSARTASNVSMWDSSMSAGVTDHVDSYSDVHEFDEKELFEDKRIECVQAREESIRLAAEMEDPVVISARDIIDSVRKQLLNVKVTSFEDSNVVASTDGLSAVPDRDYIEGICAVCGGYASYRCSECGCIFYCNREHQTLVRYHTL